MVVFFASGSANFKLPKDMVTTVQQTTPERMREQIATDWVIVPTSYTFNEVMTNVTTGQSRIFQRICCVWKPSNKFDTIFGISGWKLFERNPPINPDVNILSLPELWFKNPSFDVVYANNFGYLFDWLELYGHDEITGEIALKKQPFTVQWINFAFHIAADFLSEPIIGIHLWQCLDLLQKQAKNYNDFYLRAYNAR